MGGAPSLTTHSSSNNRHHDDHTEDNQSFNKYIYYAIKQLNFVEFAFYNQKINKSTYETEMEAAISKYTQMVSRVDNFDIEKFCTEYRLKESDNWAYHKIKKGLGKTQDLQNNTFRAQMKLLEELRDALETIQARWNNCSVYHIKTPIANCVSGIQKCKDLGC